MGLLIIAVLLILGVSAYLQPNSFLGCTAKPMPVEECKAADAIVVISGGDTSARTNEGVKLYQQGWAKALIFSGAAQDTDSQSNAAEMKQLAVSAGVPKTAISIDELARNTQQNASNVASLLKQKGYHSIILVTSGYHQRRALLEFEKHAPGVAIRSYPVASDRDWGWYWWLTPRGWWLAGGELVKIGAFYMGATEA